MSVHICHPQELTSDLAEAIGRVRRANPLVHLRSQIPLIRGINDDVETFQLLLRQLTILGVTPYYLLHCLPNIPWARQQRTSVQRGVQLMNELGRGQSSITMPTYIIVGRTGKRTVPLSGAADFLYTQNEKNWPVVNYVDWKGQWQTYLDAPELED